MTSSVHKWVSVVGARPQFVKIAPICRAIDRHNNDAMSNRVEHVIVHTGQHYEHELANLFFEQMGIPEPKFNLGVGSGTFGAQLARMCERIELVLNDERPDLVIVYGDTNSTLAAALVSARLGFPIAHVEAGCRSYDMRMPEEQCRIVADQFSRILFVPSENAAENLRREGLGTEDDPVCRKVVVAGDVMYDALLHNRVMAQAASAENLEKLKLRSGEYYLLTIHRAENTGDTRSFAEIFDAMNELDRPVLFPVHPRTRNFLEHHHLPLPANIRQLPPVGFLEMLGFEQNAKVIMTDSGGVQKEAFYLDVPCVTLRGRTEWPETIELGANRLAGTKKESILEAVAMAVRTKRAPGNPYGNGVAAIKIVSELLAESERLDQADFKVKSQSA
jgi:UDP-N-acetylglucosamine 2-epimerase